MVIRYFMLKILRNVIIMVKPQEIPKEVKAPII